MVVKRKETTDMLIQPKPYMDKIRLRRHAYGTERRRNMSKLILEKGTPLPKPIEYSDIDLEMFNWVDRTFKLTYDGVRLPTYKLYSTQRISEYAQSWNHQDEYGNIIMNFKTISRENNPQKGENQGISFNIPGHKDFAMFYVPVLQENGTEAYDKYTMKQPFSVNFIYSVSIVSNKMELVNKMNELMMYEFNAINVYVSPNGHPMPLTLEDVSDESEYTIDDRKYYSQTYKIKLKAYIIRREDYKVERVPSRIVMYSSDYDAVGIVNKRGKNRRQEDMVEFIEGVGDTYTGNKIEFIENELETDTECIVPPLSDNTQRPNEIPEEDDTNDECCQKPEDRYKYKTMKVVMKFDECTLELSFKTEKDMVLETIETENVYDFRIYVNGEKMDLENDVRLIKDDEVTVRITRDDEFTGSELTLIGYDPNVKIDTQDVPETSLDEPEYEDISTVGG